VIVTVTCDLRPSFGRIRDQGNRPTCIAFAFSDAHAVARGPFLPLSTEHIYFNAVQRMPGKRPDDGVSLTSISDALRIDGQAEESGWPYLDDVPDDLQQWGPPETATPVFRRETIVSGDTIDLIESSLNSGRPLIVTLMITQSFCDADGGFVISKTHDVDVDWHAIIVVGHGYKDGRRAFLVRNSWGDPWGLNGYAWLDFEYLVSRLHDVILLKTGDSPL
jgi:C1A family cysteine protease